jgi:hypothetical protein
MRKTLDNIVTDYKLTGDCKVDVDLVCKVWNHTWGIYQWGEQYRLIKMLRLGSGCSRIKVQISTEQATEIIKRLDLDAESGGFASATTWRQSKEYWEKHREFTMKKNKR